MSKPALSADIAYSIPVKSQPVLASSSTSSKPTSQLPSSFDSASLAHSWREHCHNVTMIKPLLKDMARLKQSLQFSIKTFIRHLELSSCSSEDLAMLMEAYVFWSKRACGMMPLVSLVNALLPLATANPPTIDLSRSLHLISDSGTLSSYMALLLSSLDVRRSWLNSLLDYDRSILSAFTPAQEGTQCSKIYQMYLAMLMDDTCLPLISLDDRFALIKHEWCVWQKEDNGQYPGIAQWLQVRAILLSGGNSQDLSVQSCFQSVAFWFCEFNDHAPTDRSFCRFVVEECLEGKLEKPGLVLTLLDEACQWQEATGRGSTCLFVLAEQVQHLLKDDRVVQTAELFAMVLSMVQVSLKTFAYMLTYDQWFQSIFLDRTSIFAQNKRFGKAWLHTLTAMLPHETPDVLQIHGKLLFDQAVDDAYRAHLTDIRTALLRMGMEASLQHMPTRLGQPMASKNSAVTHGSTASTNMHLSSSALLDASSLEKIMKSYTGSECATVSLSHDVIFKPVWFKQTFLPSLINWSPPPHLATARHDLIKLIHSKGKLPLSLHQEYKKQQ